MRFRSVPPLVAALLCCLVSVVTLRAADDPGEAFLRGYRAFQEGSKLEMAGQSEQALQKFRFCVSLLEQLQEKNPDYEPLVVEYRLKKSREAISRVQTAQVVEGEILPADVAPPEIATSEPAKSAPAGFPVQIAPYRVPVPGAPDSTRTADDEIGRAGADALRAQIRSLQSQIVGWKQMNEDLSRRLLESTAREQSALTDVDRTRVRVVEVQAQLRQTSQELSDLQEIQEQLKREKTSGDRQIAGLMEELESARADLEVADDYNGELFSKLEQAAKYIDSGEKIRLQLLDERKQLASGLDDRERDTVRMARVEKERDAALAENKALQKEIDAAREVVDQNKSLATKLEGAEKRLATLSKSTEERSKVEEGLRGELAAAGKSLEALRVQLDDGRKRITELEKQLADTATATAGVTGAMAEENTLLKSLVERQLQEQARRQQARKLAEEELDKLKIRSTSLLAKLDAMAGSEIVLSPQEMKILNRSVASAPGHSDFSLEVVKKMPESDLPAALVSRAAEANELSQKRQFAEAREIYEEIALKAPQSYLAAVNLGIAERQLGDYKQAGEAFRRALQLRSGDPFALANLGTVEYRSGNIGEAINVLQQAVAADDESYLAHYLLAVALNDNGDREGARREVKKSLELKSDYAPAMELEGMIEDAAGESSSSNLPRQAAQ